MVITDILPLGELRVESLGSRTLFTDDHDLNSVILNSKLYVKDHRLSLIKLRKGESSFFIVFELWNKNFSLQKIGTDSVNQFYCKLFGLCERSQALFDKIT